ncbi:antibiotic biosynthesis monooxygenase [Streptomyces sp. NPDC097619]|uniref:antibiotic biosynthesis monooxygenase family protein n=1 Tax=Streptomyces sp. NPDC097619 TaxID=3157228 RepID=UPI00331FCF89
MITRVSEARVRPDRFEAFHDMIVAAVSGFPARYPGLVDHEVLLAPPHSLLYVSRWRDERDLVAYAGENWRDQPVVLPGEDDYLLAPLRVRHFTSTPLPSTGAAQPEGTWREGAGGDGSGPGTAG